MSSKKDYVAIAGIMSQARQEAITFCIHEAEEVICDLAKDFAEYFAKDNPRFDRARFLAAVNRDTPAPLVKG
jgi:hypothetical protein